MMKNFISFLLNNISRELLIKFSGIAKFLLPIFLKGNNFIDPIDNRKYSYFLPYGYDKLRLNALSPGTLSLERHRLMWLYLKKTNFFTTKLKVLHFAPEQCFYKLFRNQKNINYTTTDLYSPLADIKADICNLPFENHSFDVIFCNHVLEHIIDDKKAMQELYRILKPGGWGIFQIPIDEKRKITYEDFTITGKEERKKHFGQYDHVRIYGNDYYKRLENVGFKIEKINLSKDLSKEEILQFGLQENEILPLVKK